MENIVPCVNKALNYRRKQLTAVMLARSLNCDLFFQPMRCLPFLLSFSYLDGLHDAA